jgi:serine/threonine protein kinase
MIGKRLDGKYEVVSELGAGGMGAVYEAVNVATKGRVAIKVILGQLSADSALVARFQREAQAAGSIESRHIARVIDAGKDPETNAPYLVMELLRGEDLDALMKSFGAFRPTLALRIVAQALAGLERAHAANVVHRDIKPANLYVAQSDGGQRVVKLVDFGIAKVKDDVTASREFSLTQTASLLGSPLYMSPEQARTSKTVDGRADLWSLGVVLYQMLSGRAPHAEAGSLTELLLAICTEPARPIQDTAPWVSPEIAALVTRAIEIEQNKRFRTATEMLAEITAIVPDWQQLDETMLTPMTPAERSFIAQRIEPASQLGVSTGPNSSRGSDERVVASRTVEPNIERISNAPTSSLASSVAVSSQPGVGSEPGVRAISVAGNASIDGLASTKASGEVVVPRSKSRGLVYALGAGALGLIAIGIGWSAMHKGPPASPPTSVLAVPSESAPPAASVSAVVAATAAPEETAPAAIASVSARPSPKVAPVAAGAKPVASKPQAAPATSPVAAPPPKPAAPAPSSSPISRDFN